MGYTHYWHRPEELDPDTFGLFVEDAYNLAVACEIPIAKEWDDPESPPVFEATEIWFNGIGDDGHETFYIAQKYDPPSWRPQPDENGLHFDFCKTAQKPYDVLVAAILIAFRYRFGAAVRISSDGSWDDHDYEWNGQIHHAMSDWADGRTLYRRVFPDRDVETNVMEDAA